MLTINTIKDKDFKRVFFFRVCGTGMGAAACLLREKGYEVEGGDYNFYPPMSDYLNQTGIKLFDLNDFDKEQLKNYDLIVVGNVVPGKSEDAAFIESLGVDYCSFPTALGGLVLGDVHVVGIAGTHGKTTTSYYLTQMLESLGEKPGYFIGGVIEGRPPAALGSGKFFVIESDEYDSAYFEKISKFRSYEINDLVLTSLEFDHADIFSSVEDIKDEFRALLNKLPGNIIYNSDYQASRELALEYKDRKWDFYNENSSESIMIEEETLKGTAFSILINEKRVGFETNVVGKHNILNVTACILYCMSKGFDLAAIQKAVTKLAHVKRRQEIRGIYRGASVIDDFAHHPRSVAYTIDAIKTKFHDKRVIVVLEPNSATARSNIFQKEFSSSLEYADEVVLVQASRKTTAKNAEDLDYDLIVNELKSKGRQAIFVNDLGQLRGEIDKSANENSVLLILSNGTCLDLWKSDFVDEIQ